MSFTYDVALGTDNDRVRFLLQDTDSTKPLLQDEEIAWVVAAEANVYMAAAFCADLLASKARLVKSKSVGGLSISYGPEVWEKVAEKLRLRGSTNQVLTAGGVFKDDRDAIWENADLLRPSFFSRLHEEPTALPPRRGSDYSEEELP